LKIPVVGESAVGEHWSLWETGGYILRGRGYTYHGLPKLHIPSSNQIKVQEHKTNARTVTYWAS
jgi:hypothetical protein